MLDRLNPKVIQFIFESQVHYHRQPIKALSEHLPDLYRGGYTNPNFAWSLKINTLITLEISGNIDQVFKLYLDYSDSRGRHGLFVDEVLWTGEDELVFSNLIHLPIKGPLKNPELVVSYRYPTVKLKTKASMIACDNNAMSISRSSSASRLTG